MGDGSLTVLVTVKLGDEALRRVQEAVAPHRLIYVPERGERDRYVPEAHIIFGAPRRELVEQAPRLRWLQLFTAGVDHYALPEPISRPDILVTNARGVYGVAGAEHVLGWMLMFNRGLLEFYRFQMETRWNREVRLARKLQGQTLGIVGLGDLGSELARRAKAFDMRVLAIRRRVTAVPDYVDALWTLERLPDLLEQSDHVALTLPLTRETKGIINKETLARMKPTAYLYNIGRGALVDEGALVEALEKGTIAGAGLDVFMEEPLPADHPLWRLPNVLITPHLGADSPWDMDEAARIFCDNLRRFRAGEPLRNVVDLRRGY